MLWKLQEAPLILKLIDKQIFLTPLLCTGTEGEGLSVQQHEVSSICQVAHKQIPCPVGQTVLVSLCSFVSDFSGMPNSILHNEQMDVMQVIRSMMLLS